MEETNSPVPGNNKPEESTATGNSGGKTTPQCSVIIVYKAKIGNKLRRVTVVWNKTLINHSLSISVDGSGGSCDPPSTCRVDLKPWPFWSKKGFKSVDVGDHRVDLFWNLRHAKFSGGGSPEPTGSYYVALVSGEEVVLLLGDLKKKAYKRTKARPSLDDAKMVLKKENVFGKRSFSTKARFDERKREHEIVVENSISGVNGKEDAEMWIRIDGIVMMHVSNLQWKFRGNETVMVEGSPVQVFWDVHDWFFGGPGMGQALFIFKPGAAAATAMATALAEMALMEEEEENEERSESDLSWSSENEGKQQVVAEQNECGDGSSEFCFMLCAWRVEK
ncbi:uncharacterized protein LOC110097488 [Dendrobium catenatum]|uniref:DUF868 domain-containing protein n=1 Tax=Dendrobium catenatum TaxID=906689 RepID=A0A2I0WJN1_9ASPA|nr:uncharacterized protein LOC110097488 [Dendrobium catenatum]PKU75864.1 hypothetical protein MA16_Dca005911 [Dendrobium catenatum]